MSTLLQVTDLHVHYGAIEAVKGIELTLVQGRITTLLGANGAGKSTTLLTLSGLLRASAGSIEFNGRELRNLAPHWIVDSGVVQVAEGREILTTLTVRENLLLGAYRRSDRRAIRADLEHVLAMFPRLRERIDGAAGNLSGGEQQMLAIARGLIARPKVLLLDEPSLGLAPALINELYRVLAELRDEGMTILLVDQMATLALAIADRGYVMESGAIVHTGSAAELRHDPVLERAYLGEA